MAITVCISDAVITHRGERIPLSPGVAYDDRDPLVREHPDLFSTDAKYLRRTEPIVESATAAPGERRGTRRP